MSYFLWLSVKVMPCAETLKWTMVAVGVGSATSVSATAFAMAWGPVSDSISTELMKRTLQAGRGDSKNGVSHYPGPYSPCSSPLYSPAPCLRRSVAELLADAVSFFSSMGSRRDRVLLLLPAWKPAPSPQAVGADALSPFQLLSIRSQCRCGTGDKG